MDLLYATAAHLAALRDWLEDALPTTVDGATLVGYELEFPPTAVAPFWVLELAVADEVHRPRGPMMAGDQETSLVVRARSIGRTLPQALVLADLIRWRLVGRAGDGAHFLPMTDLAGSPVTDRRIASGAIPDTPARVPQVSEDFAVDLQRGEDDDL